MSLFRWYVVTPEYGTVDPITDEGQGPMEYGCDVIEVEALNMRDAKALGVKAMLSSRSREYRWCRDARSDGCSPYAGVKVIPVSDEELRERTHRRATQRARAALKEPAA